MKLNTARPDHQEEQRVGELLEELEVSRSRERFQNTLLGLIAQLEAKITELEEELERKENKQPSFFPGF